MQISYKMIQNLIRLLVVLGAIALVILILIDKNSYGSSTGGSSVKESTTASNTNSHPYAVLAPATVAPKVQECNQTVGYASNGVPAPLQCANGDVNVAAWDALSAQEPKLMSLGYSPNSADIQTAVCADINASASDSAPGADDALEYSTFQISALYYGWNFAGSASSYISKC